MQGFISDEMTDLQLLVLEKLHQDVLPELRITRNVEVDSCFKAMLRKSVDFLRSSLNWLATVSAKQRFCWGILANYCYNIVISKDTLEWARHYFISKDLNLGLVFSDYCTFRCLTNNQRMIDTELPKEIQDHQLDDLRRYINFISSINP